MFDGTETVEQRASVNETRFHPLPSYFFKILVKISKNFNSKFVWFSFLTLKRTGPVEDLCPLSKNAQNQSDTPRWSLVKIGISQGKQ